MLQAIEPYIKTIARVGGLLGKLFAVGLTLYGLKEIWFHKESQHYSTFFKLNLSLLYILHVVSVSLAIAVLCGYASVSIPVAAAFVSATALLKNGFDLLKDNFRLYKLRRDLITSRAQLAIQYETLNQHLEEFNQQNQSFFSKAYEFIGRQFSNLIDVCKNITFTRSAKEEDNLEALTKIKTELDECRENHPQDVDSLANDLESIIATSKKIIDLQKEIALINYDLSAKRYIMQFSGITASLTLLLCFPFNWYAGNILNHLLLGLGIASALTSVWGIYHKHFIENKMIAIENREIHDLIRSSVATVDKLNQETARKELNEKLDKVVENFDQQQSKQGSVLPLMFSTKLPIQYQATTDQRLSDYIKEDRAKEEEHKQPNQPWWDYVRKGFKL